MKIQYATAISLLFSLISALAQVQDNMPGTPNYPPAFSASPLPDPSEWADTPMDWVESVRQFPQSITNNQTGEVTLRVRQVIAVGNGLNYIDSNGVWQQSQDLVELTTNGGAAALRAPTKAFFEPTLSSSAGIKLITMSNLVFTTYPVGVYFYDPSTGKEALLAALQNGVAGKLLPPNRIIYPGAFQSDVLQADLRVTVTKGAVECDTIITHQPKVSPESFSMDSSTTLLQVRHAWSTPTLPALVSSQNTTALADTFIDFGDLLFAPGRAFAWDGGGTIDTNVPAAIALPSPASDDTQEPVGKAWQNGTNGSSSFLTESVLWQNVQARLAQLPQMAKIETEPGSDPASPLYQESREKSTLPSSKKRMALAGTRGNSQGFVMDWILVSGSGNYTFATYNGTNTYWLSTNTLFNGTVTFQSNCVIKRNPNTTLELAGLPSCKGLCSKPSIVTVVDDNMYGEQLGSNCATATGFGLWIWGSVTEGANISGMNVRFAQTGIEFDGDHCGEVRVLTDSTIESCQTGVYVLDCTLTLQNSVTSCVATPSELGTCGLISGTWGSTCNQVSLHGSVVAGMQALTNSHNPSTDIALYNRDTSTNAYVTGYNTNCWIYGLKGLTSLSVSNGYYSSGPNPVWYQGDAVLITTKHLLTVDHLNFGTGAVFRFMGKSGTHYLASVTNATTIKTLGLGDTAILTLDRDLPSDVETIKILPDGVMNKMTFDIQTYNPNSCPAKYLPCIGVDQLKGAYAEDVFSWAPSGNLNSVRGSVWFPSWMNGYEPWGGDSGHPILAVINNELVLVGCWSQQDTGIGPTLPTSLGTNTGNGYNAWFGFAFSSTNTLVILDARRFNQNTNTCNQTHTLAFFNSAGTNLTSVAVTAVQSNVYFSGTALTNASYPINGLLTLPGTTNSTNYYLLSQEFTGGDYWYYYENTTNWFDYPNTSTLNIPDYFVSGAAASVNLSTFVIYTNSVGETFGPVGFSYYVYPHIGYLSTPGSNTNGINQCLTNAGAQYAVRLVDISAFPNNIR